MGSALKRPGVCLVAVLCVVCARAQERPNQLELLERERLQQLRDDLHRQSALPAAQAAAAWLPPVAGEAPCFEIQSIRLNGDGDSAGKAFGWLTRDLSGFLGACLGPQSIDRLRRNLDAMLMARGYVTSHVTLPQQNLAGGQLHFELHLGRIGNVAWRDSSPLAANAVTLRAGDVLNLRDVEQTLDNLARLPSRRAQFGIEPGDEPGTSTVVIASAGGKPINGSLGIDNSGVADYGRAQAALQFSWDDPLFNWAGQLRLNATHNLAPPEPDRRQHLGLLSYTIPVGAHLLSWSASRQGNRRGVQGVSTTFTQHGADTSQEWRWQWSFWRSGSSRWSVSLGGQQRHADSYIDDIELLLQRRRSKATELGLQARLQWGQADWSLDWAHSWHRQKGVDDGFTPASTLRHRSQRVSAQLNLAPASVSPAETWAYESRWQWQGTHGQTSAADMPSLGSRWTVRGFGGEYLVSGAELFSWRQDLMLPMWRPVEWGQLQPFVGLDMAFLSRPLLSQLGRGMAGGAVGLKGWLFSRAYLELTLAAPLRRPAGLPQTGAQLYVSLTHMF